MNTTLDDLRIKAGHSVLKSNSYTVKEWINWIINIAQAESIKRDKEIAELLVEFYNGRQRDNLIELLKVQFPKSFDEVKFQLEILNVVKMFIDQTSVVYKFGATRELESDGKPATDKERDLWNWIIESVKYDRKLKDVNKKVNLTENAMVRVWFDTKLEHLKLDIITRDNIDVVSRKEDLTEAEAIFYAQPVDIYARNKVDTIYHYWNDEEYIRFNNNNQMLAIEDNPENKNPYGLLPFVRFCKRFPENDYFVIPPEDLAIVQENINQKLVELNNMLKFQAFATPVLIGNADATAGIDPSIPIIIPTEPKDMQQGNFRYESPNANFEALVNEISEKIRRLAQTRGLGAGDFSVTAEYKSGIALEISNRAFMDILLNEKSFYEDAEQELFEVIKAVWNYHSSFVSSGHQFKGVKFGDKTHLIVRVREPQLSKDIDQELRLMDFELENGLIGIIGYYMYRYEMDEQEAIEYYKQQQKLRNEYPQLRSGEATPTLAELGEID